MEEANRSKMVAIEGNRLCNRFTVGGEPFRRRYRLYPIYRGEGDLGAVGLNLRVPIGCCRSRLFLGAEPKLDSFLPFKAGDVPVTTPEGFLAITDGKEQRAVTRHIPLLRFLVQKR